MKEENYCKLKSYFTLIWIMDKQITLLRWIMFLGKTHAKFRIKSKTKKEEKEKHRKMKIKYNR